MNHPEHERADVDIRGIVRFLVGLIVGCALAVLVLNFLWRGWTSAGPAAPLTGWDAVRVTPTGPVIGATPINERLGYQQRDQERLSTYGWVDRGAGKVRIPIAEAIRAVASGARIDARATEPAAKEKKQ